MKPTRQLHDLGQSLWLDNITRELLSDGSLRRYIGELWVTGLTSNPTIFDKATRTDVSTMARFDTKERRANLARLPHSRTTVRPAR